MKPWIKYCIIYSVVYLTISSLFSALTVYKISFLELLVFCIVFDFILFLIFRKKLMVAMPPPIPRKQAEPAVGQAPREPPSRTPQGESPT